MNGQLNYERVKDDFYATEPENLDCLAHYIAMADSVVWEPACGEGHLSKRMVQLGAAVFSTDLIDRGYGTPGIDFLRATRTPRGVKKIITNPPFGDMAEQFVRHALELTEPVDGMVAMFLRNEWDMSSSDRPDLFEGHPAYAMKICVTKRPRWIAGSKGSPRHNYAWYVWDWSRRDRFSAMREHVGLARLSHPDIRYIHPKNARPLLALQEVA